MQKIRDKGVTMKVSELMSKENCNEVGYTQPYVRKLPSKTKFDQVPSAEQKSETGGILFLIIVVCAAIYLSWAWNIPILTWISNWFSQNLASIIVLVAAGILFVFWCLSFDDVVEEEPFEFTFPNAHRTSSEDGTGQE